MPEEVFWQSFYAADCIVEKLKHAKESRESIAEQFGDLVSRGRGVVMEATHGVNSSSAERFLQHRRK